MIKSDHAQFLVAYEQICDGPFGDGYSARPQLLMDFWDATMLGVPQLADQGDDIKTKRAMW